jgi:hypothetical protein
MTLANEKQKFQYLGPPGTIKNLGSAKIPMKLKLSWKLDYNVDKIQCHHILIPHIEAIYTRIAKLNAAVIKDAGLDIYGGCYNFRPIRGTESQARPPFSTHSWGAAIDVDPVRNGLFVKATRANLAQAKFDAIHDIWMDHGFINIGHIIGRDFMHYEASLELISNPSIFI